MCDPKVWRDTHYGDARKTLKVRRDLFYGGARILKVRRDVYYGDVRP